MSYSSDFIAQVKFGNPSLQDFNNLKVRNYLHAVIPTLSIYNPPGNNTNVTRQELNKLIEYVSAGRPGAKEVFDQSLVPFVQSLFIQHYPDSEAEILKITQQIVDDVFPIITTLKYHFQRPRPLQLAFYYDLQLFPSFSSFTSSPSYPSGHATLARVLGHVLGNRFPETNSAMQEFIVDVAESRMYMGVHYPSDNQMALITANEIFRNKEFCVKYQL